MSDAMYLGRDVHGGATYALEPEKLRTHGVVVGMTGSGKTGMALVMLEELVHAGVPVIAIDPKGDLGNLGLLFPKLAAADFAPWADGADPDEVSTRWKKGIDDWSLGDRLAELRDRMALTLYTPGSEAGVPVDVLGSLRRPEDKLLTDDEGRRALVSDTVSGLLGLVGESADPVRDPSHIVLSTILETAWLAGEDPDLETLLLRLVDPPFKKVGVFPVDTFFPPKDRMALAMRFNGVIASPSFQSWTKGVPLDLDALLEEGGKARVSVFCLAHLQDQERLFFLSLLLGRLLAWTRTQPGTERLRGVLFFDEVAGYLPPHPADPPTKRPLMLLMKQARAMGFGVVLATQNPVDIDYKGLSNAGLWAVGRLRTEQDRARVLQGVSGEGLDAKIAGLEKRQFLFALASGDSHVVQTRQAMCFLRGPFTRNEIASFRDTDLHADPPGEVRAAPKVKAAPAEDDEPAASAPPASDLPQWWVDPAVVFSARLEGRFTPFREPARKDGKVGYRPALYANLALRFDEESAGFVEDVEHHRVWFPLDGGSLPDEHLDVPFESGDLLAEAPEDAVFAELPTWMDEKKELTALQKRVVDDVFRNESTGMFVCAPLKLYGRSGEEEAAFRARCEAAVNERVADAVAKLQDTYRDKTDRLEKKIRETEAKVADLRQQASSKQTEELLNVGETVLGWFFGRKKSITSAVSKRRSTSSSNAKADAAEDTLAALQEELEGLEHELVEEMEQIRDKESKALVAIEPKEVRLEKADITVRQFGVLWIPTAR